VSAKVDGFASDREKPRLETLPFQHAQSFFQNMLSGLLPWTSTDTYNHNNPSKFHNRQYALKLCPNYESN
jgi:hypothetical protein